MQRNATFAPVAVDTTVADTLLRLNPLEANRRYYWRVSAGNPATRIDYSIAADSFVPLNIYDILGREIMTLVNKKIPAGKQTAHGETNALRAGVYVYQIRAGDFVETKK